MTISKEVRPYEVLFRWDADGKLAGGHYQFRTIVSEDGTVLADILSDAQPIAVAGNEGFPLSDVLTAAHLDPTAAVNEATAERDAALAARDAAIQEVETVRATLRSR